MLELQSEQHVHDIIDLHKPPSKSSNFLRTPNAFDENDTPPVTTSGTDIKVSSPIHGNPFNQTKSPAYLRTPRNFDENETTPVTASRSKLQISRPVPYYPNGPDESPQFLRSPSHYFESSPGNTPTFEHTPFRKTFAEAEMEEGYKKKPPQAVIDAQAPLTGLALVSVVSVLCLVAFLVMLGGGIVATAIPSITTEFNSVGDIGWYGVAYLLSNCAVQPLSGKIYMSFNTKWTFLGFLTFFQIGAAICGAAQSSSMLIAGRAVAGIGGAGLTNGGLIIISRVTPLKKRPMYLNIIMSMVAFGQLLAPLIGGVLAQSASWRWCFLINLPFGAVVVVVVLIVGIPNSTMPALAKLTPLQRILSQLDLIGFGLFASAMAALLIPLQWGGSVYPWVSVQVTLPLIVGGIIAAIFLTWSYTKGDKALIPFSVLKRREVWCSCLVTLFSRGAMFVHTYYLPLWFQLVQGATPIMSGVYNLPSFITQILISVIAARLVAKFGLFAILSCVGGGLNTLGAGLMTTWLPSTPIGLWIGYQIILGAGRGLIMQMPLAALSAVLPKQQMTAGLSMITFCQFFGGTLFIAGAQTIFINELPITLHQYAPALGASIASSNSTSGGSASFNPTTTVIPPAILPGVLLAYNQSIMYTFIFATVGAGCCFLASFGMGFHKPGPPAAAGGPGAGGPGGAGAGSGAGAGAGGPGAGPGGNADKKA